MASAKQRNRRNRTRNASRTRQQRHDVARKTPDLRKEMLHGQWGPWVVVLRIDMAVGVDRDDFEYALLDAGYRLGAETAIAPEIDSGVMVFAADGPSPEHAARCKSYEVEEYALGTIRWAVGADPAGAVQSVVLQGYAGAID
jgi:hypothetical protein